VKDELARLHGIIKPTLSVERWGAVDISLASPHSVVAKELLVSFGCEIKKAVGGAFSWLTFDGSIRLTVKVASLPLLISPRNGSLVARPPVQWSMVRCEVGTDSPGASPTDALLLRSARLANIDPESDLAGHVQRFLDVELYKIVEKLALDLWAFQPPSALASPELALLSDTEARDGYAEAQAGGEAARAAAGRRDESSPASADLVGVTGDHAAEWRRWAAERTAADLPRR